MDRSNSFDELLKAFGSLEEEEQKSLGEIMEEHNVNPLEEFSTTQLKAEIRRRKGTRKRHIKDSTELSGGHLW